MSGFIIPLAITFLSYRDPGLLGQARATAAHSLNGVLNSELVKHVRQLVHREVESSSYAVQITPDMMTAGTATR